MTVQVLNSVTKTGIGNSALFNVIAGLDFGFPKSVSRWLRRSKLLLFSVR